MDIPKGHFALKGASVNEAQKEGRSHVFQVHAGKKELYIQAKSEGTKLYLFHTRTFKIF